MTPASPKLPTLRKTIENLYRPTSLRFRLTALVLLIAVPVLLASTAFIGTRAATIIERNSDERLQSANRTLSAIVSGWLESHLNALRNLTSLPDIVSMNAERQRPLLRTMATAYPYMYLIGTTDLKGMNLARNDDEKPIDYSDRTWFQQARKGASVVFESLISKTNKRPALAVSMPIKNQSGRIVGVGLFATNLDKLTEEVQITRLGRTGYAYLIDRNNRVLAHPDPAYTGLLRDLSTYPPVAALRKGTIGQISFSDDSGLRWRAYASKLENGWGVVIQQQEDELYNTRRLFQRVALAIIFIAVLVLMSATWWIARRALQPIETLTQAVASVASDASSRPDLESVRHAALTIRTRDEVGTLAQSFSQMTVRLGATLTSLEQELIERTQAQEALRQSEEKYRIIVDTASEGIWGLDENHRISFVNSRMAEMLGYTAEEMIGRELEFFVFKEDLKDQAKKMELRRQGMTETYERRWRRSDGQAVWTIVAAKPILYAEHKYKGAFAMITDITERKQTEEALRESEGKYRTLIENINIGVYRTKPDGRYLQVNPAMAKIFGYDEVEHLMKTPVKNIYQNPNDRKQFLEKLRIKGTVRDLEMAMKKKDGTPIWTSLSATAQFDEQGAIQWIDGVLEDITERKQAEEGLKESEKKFRELFEESKDVVFISSPQGNYTDINRAGVELLGYSSKEELLTIDITRDIYVYSEERERFQSDLKKYGFVKDYELPFKKKNGEKLNVLITASAVQDQHGAIIAYRGIVRDVTNQRNLEAQLLQAQKMEAIGQLSGGVAHNFNNILTTIMGYASLMKSKTKEDATLQSYLDQVLTASTHAKNLTKNLLAFSRRQVMNSRPVNVNEIITDLVKMLAQLIREDIEIKTLLAREDLTIMADGGQIVQALINLVTNARDAMPKGGSLTIETTLCDINEKYLNWHLFVKQGRYACISVTDTGIGMDEKTKEKIFEPFFTTKEVGRGTGLGLSIVYGIIKQHNGNINVYSEPGLGTTFRIYFPMIEAKPDEKRPQELPEPKGGAETILLAEDDADVRNLTKTILAGAGYRVLEAVDGDDAIKVFDEHKDAIQLVLLDVIMPKKNGKEVYNWIKTAGPGAKVLFMSGYSADIIFKKGVLAEGLNLISKPVTSPELLNKVREVLDKKE